MRRKTQVQITIPEPCHQAWQTMLPDSQGRFCNHCQKTVVDFSRMSDAEIMDVLSQTDRPSCGRFRNTQINRPIVTYSASPSRSWPRLAAGAVVLMLAMPHALLAQAPSALQPQVTASVPSQSDSPTLPQTAPGGPDFKLKGHLVDAETGAPIIFAKVQISALAIGGLSDENGDFEFAIPLELASETLLLKASSGDGDYEAEIELSKNDLPSEITIALHSNFTRNLDISVGAMVVTPKPMIPNDRNDPEPLFGSRKNKRSSK